MKKVLLSGASGFIGSNLTKALLKKNYHVIGIDNLITGSIDNISNLFQNENFRFIEADVTKYIKIEEKIDYVFHFASPASPIDYLKYPIQTLKSNAIGGHNLLGLAKKNKAKFILASTSEVYGDPLEHPQKESYYGNVNPIGPRSIYDESKRFIESMTIAYNKCHDLDTSILRIFNTYGPKMKINDGRVLPTFIKQASQNQDITINGNGKQTRSFCYIDDLISGILKIMNVKYSRPINLGNDDEVSIKEVAKLIIDLLNSRSKLVFKDLPIDDPLQRKPDITLAKKKLNWKPTIKKEDGIKALINYYKLNKII